MKMASEAEYGRSKSMDKRLEAQGKPRPAPAPGLPAVAGDLVALARQHIPLTACSEISWVSGCSCGWKPTPRGGGDDAQDWEEQFSIHLLKQALASRPAPQEHVIELPRGTGADGPFGYPPEVHGQPANERALPSDVEAAMDWLQAKARDLQDDSHLRESLKQADGALETQLIKDAIARRKEYRDAIETLCTFLRSRIEAADAILEAACQVEGRSSRGALRYVPQELQDAIRALKGTLALQQEGLTEEQVREFVRVWVHSAQQDDAYDALTALTVGVEQNTRRWCIDHIAGTKDPGHCNLCSAHLGRKDT
jgi:hypothetical protein